MNKEFILKFYNILKGSNIYADRESFRIELAESIMSSLKDDDFIVKANRMVIGCADGRYEEAIEESRNVILKKLRNQGGSMRTLAERLSKNEDSIYVTVATAPEDKNVVQIPKERLQIKNAVWFVLEAVKEDLTGLVLTRNDWSATLDPAKRYTIGRSENPRDSNVMLTIPDAKKSISRWQAELRYIDGEWYCKPISDKCPTFVDDRYAEADNPFPLKNTQSGGLIKFGMGVPGFILKYSAV